MLIILLKILFGLFLIIALGLAITAIVLLIRIISDHRHDEEFIRQAGYHDKSFKVEGNYTSRGYQFE